MTREDKLYSMRMQDLEVVAEKLGIKINKKAAKAVAVEKILKAEAEKLNEEADKETKENFNTTHRRKRTAPTACQPAEPVKVWDEPPKRNRGALIEYNGKSQNICAWAKELGKSANTLYGRIYKLGWSVEKAFTK